ncbi:class I SAM-dependent methyltransferase [Hydrogenophaga sp.]|uniref:class I SAM-dependent methyltransferase n=1 Tax=Hydrogenophaga sp. TaxID=1904254 RepID=UPI002726B112|nr:methyltransferase domain-containing protein [Hydrogenophaga sp.]MDO9438054.1 methyltransferase domain-containing protein [Hydrogenophaga sp.]
MEPRLQRRVQRYGWDLAADDYETLWQAQLADAQTRMLARVALQPGEHVLDVACGTGLVTLQAARAAGPPGRVIGVDLSGRMVQAAEQRARASALHNVRFDRMDAEQLALADASSDVVLCALGLMYIPEPEQAVREMVRVLRPGGRVGLAVWGERERCGWWPLFSIVDAEVSSEVCPLFFRLGQADTLTGLCADAGLVNVRRERLPGTLQYADGEEACRAAFAGGPVALAWSRFGDAARARACARYLDAIAPWRSGSGYAVPVEFLIVTGCKPS